MKTNNLGLALLKQWEGCRLNSYQDSAGVWTIGYGETLNIKPGMTITQDQADKVLLDSLVKYEATVNAVNQVDLSQNEFNTLVCLCYNIGQGAYQNSTLVKELNNSNRKSALIHFMDFIKIRDPKTGNLVVLEGLINRRRAEQILFIS